MSDNENGTVLIGWAIDFIHRFFRKVWRILKMDSPSQTENPSLVRKRPLIVPFLTMTMYSPNLYNGDTSVKLTLGYVSPTIKWTPLYHGDFCRSQRYQTSYNPYLYKTAMSRLRTVFMNSRTPKFMQFLLLYADNSSVWTLGCVFPSIIRTYLYYGHSGILFSRSFYASLTNNFTLENISLILIDASREKFLSPLAVFPVFR